MDTERISNGEFNELGTEPISDEELAPNDNSRNDDWKSIARVMEKLYQCDFCSKKFADESNLHQHLEIWHDKIFIKETEPVSSSESEDEDLVVPLLKDKGNDAESPSKDDSSSQDEESLELNTKFNSLNQEGDLINHENETNETDEHKSESQKSIQEPPFPCKLCDKKFYRKNNLILHEKYHNQVKKNPRKKIKLDYHPKKSSKSSESKVKSGTESENLRTCQFCSKVFTFGYNRKRHERICPSNSETNVQLLNADKIEELNTTPKESVQKTKESFKPPSNNFKNFKPASKTVLKLKNSRPSGPSRPSTSRKSGPLSKQCTIDQDQEIKSKPIYRKGYTLPGSRKPVQLTWKGTQIFFPIVTLTKDLREKADEALRLKESKALLSQSDNFINLLKDGHIVEDQDEDDRGSVSSTSTVPIIISNVKGSKPMPKSKQKSSSTTTLRNVFPCKICGISSQNKRALIRHMKIHSKAKNRKYGPCEKCQARFSNNDSFRKHINLCGKSIDRTTSVIDSSIPESVKEPVGKIHYEEVNFEDLDFSVKTEGIDNDNDYAMDDGNMGNHSDNDTDELPEQAVSNFTKVNKKMIPCGVCKEEFLNEKELRQHSKEHAKSKACLPFDKMSKGLLFNCQVCLKQFSAQSHLDIHMYWKHVKGPTIITCDVCSKTFSSKSKFASHSLSHSRNQSIKPQPFQSQEKPSTSTTTTSETIAISSVSSLSSSQKITRQIFTCEVCSKTFDRPSRLARHLLTHSKKSNNTSTTDLTGTDNSRSTRSSVIMKDSATGEISKYKCDACGVGFNDKMELSRHCLSHALGENFTVVETLVSNDKSRNQLNPNPTFNEKDDDNQSTSFKTRNLGSQVEESCTIPSPVPDKLIFSCNYKSCSHGFSHDEDLWYHIEKKHKNFDELCCSQCGKNFDSEDFLSIHMKQSHPLIVNKNSKEKELQEDKQKKIIPVLVKLEASDFPSAETIDQNHFDDTYHENNYDENMNDEDLVDTDPALLIPQTQLIYGERKNPYILITSDLKAAADAVLKENPHLILSQTKKNSKGKYRCDICVTRTFYKKNMYLAHMNYHRNLLKTGVIRAVKHRNKAKKIHIPSDLKCRICNNRSFNNRASYIAHAKYHRIIQKRQGFNRAVGDIGGIFTGNMGRKFRDDVPIQDTYKCDICENRSFKDRTNFFSHMSYHRKFAANRPVGNNIPGSRKTRREDIPIQDEYTCLICDNRKFPTRISYIAHYDYHKRSAGNRPIRGIGTRTPRDIPFQDVYSCEYCENRQFTDRIAYISHYDYHKRNGINRPLYPRGTVASRNLRVDIPFQDIYTCEICKDKQFTIRSNYISHMAYHKNRGIDKPTGIRGRLREDIPFQETYKCTICDNREFPTRISYIAHYDYHKKFAIDRPISRERRTRREDIPLQDIYECNECEDKTFTDRAKYILHMNYHSILAKRKQLQHSNQCVYRCKICPDIKTFTDRNKYIAHQNYHKQKNRSNTMPENPSTDEEADRNDVPDQQTYSCLKCGEEKTFTSREIFMNHLKEHKIMEKKAYQCSMCEKAFTSAWNLSQHAKTHTGEKTFSCGDCGKRFRYDYSRKRHQEKWCKKIPCKYVCHCGDKFHTIKCLEIHVKRFHKAPAAAPLLAKLSRCYVCGQEFENPTELNKHVMAIHPNDYNDFMKQKGNKIIAAVADQQKQYQMMNMEGETNPEKNAEYDDNIDELPLAPQVIILEENDDDFDPMTSQVVLDDDDDDDVEEEESESQLPASGWNFIPALENKGNVSDGDSDYYDDFPTESFEPEDIEVDGVIPMDPFGQNKDRIPTCEQQLDMSEPLIFTSGMSSLNSDVQSQSTDKTILKSKRSKKPKNPGRFKCGYCDKVSSQRKFTQQHWKWVHKGLPFICIDLKMLPSLDPEQRKPESCLNTITPKTVSGLSSMLLKRSSVSKDGSEKNNSNLPQDNEKTIVSTGKLFSRPRSKSKTECNCGISDTALGYLKRCVGETCACYSNTKGCSDECACIRNCNNPYFRSKYNSQLLQPQIKPLPDLVPIPSNTLPVSFIEHYNAVNAPTTTINHTSYNLRIPDTRTRNNRVVPSATLSKKKDNSRNKVSTTDLDNEFNKLIHESSAKDSETRISNNTATVQNQQGKSYIPAIQSAALAPQPLTNSNIDDDEVMILETPSQPSTSSSVPYQQGQVISKVATQSVPNIITRPPVEGNENMFKCRHCDNTSTSLPTYLGHQWDHREKQIFVCPLCPVAYHMISTLIEHANSHVSELPSTESPAEIFQCHAESCQSVFKSNEEFSWHFKVFHPELVCKVCKATLSSVAALNEHEQKHYQCNTCGKRFCVQISLKHHLRKAHDIL